jgi:hypothetical protein
MRRGEESRVPFSCPPGPVGAPLDTEECPDLRENRSGHRGGGGIRTVEARFAEVHVNGISRNYLPHRWDGEVLVGTGWHALALAGSWHLCPERVLSR